MDATYLHDFGIIFQLVILEGLLSLDNALALAALVEKRLSSPTQRKRALTWGIWGAYLFRIGIIFIGTWLIAMPWVKIIAGMYLIWLAISELFFKHNESDHKNCRKEESKSNFLHLSPFWSTIIAVELMDIMFSIDSIGVALVLSKKKWVLIVGAMLGILMMRVAAQLFIHLIARFPILMKTAFVMVGFAGINIVLETKNLVVPFAAGYTLTLDAAIPEGPFLALLFTLFFGSFVLTWMFPKRFAGKKSEV